MYESKTGRHPTADERKQLRKLADEVGVAEILRVLAGIIKNDAAEITQEVEEISKDTLEIARRLEHVPNGNPRTITILGRRWFRKGPGNTYHSAEITVDGEPVEGIDYASGYGEQYLYNAFYKLEKLGLITPMERSGMMHESPWRWAERNHVKLTYSVVDVARKKDL